MGLELTSSAEPALRRTRVRWAGSPALLFIPALLLLVPTFVIPIAATLGSSFSSDDGVFGNYAEALGSELIRATFLRTFATAAVTTLIALLIGLPFASIAARSGRRLQSVLMGAVLASLFFSVIVRSYAWLALLGTGGPVVGFIALFGVDTQGLSLAHTPLAVGIGLVQYGIPFMVLAISDVLRRLDGNLPRAAASLGAGPVTRWFRITLPLLTPGILAGCTVVFTTTLGYFLIPAILGSPRELMIGQLINQQVGTTLNWGLGAAISGLLLVAAFIVLGVFNLAARRAGRH